MNNLEIQVNLSIDRSGGAEKLPIVIEKIKEILISKYTNANIAVRKGYFQTIDGIWSNDSDVERELFTIVADVRKQVL